MLLVISCACGSWFRTLFDNASMLAEVCTGSSGLCQRVEPSAWVVEAERSKRSASDVSEQGIAK